MKNDLIKEAKDIIETYGSDTVASRFAENVLKYLDTNKLPDRNVKTDMTHIPDSSGM